MKIIAENIGKKFGKQWVFRNLSFEITTEKPTAITGKNGSGKSTLLQILAGYLTPSEGHVTTNEEEGKTISFVSPQLEIIEEFSLREFLLFNATFKNQLISTDDIALETNLPLDKPISEFSSGMKQRVKLVTSFYFENDFLFLDEPTVNLDEMGIQWFFTQLHTKRSNICVIASNLKDEIKYCENMIDL